MPQRDPHAVLGVAPGASQAAIKAAWRRLARAHHPDLTAGDPAAARAANRRMAEINAAYAQLREVALGRGPSDGRSRRSAGTGSATAPPGAGAGRRPSGPPRPKPTRPVTGRVDTSATFRPRNQTTTPEEARPRPKGHPPLRIVHRGADPLRASEPTGPVHSARLRRYRPPRPPALADALEVVLGFGKFRGHTLGEVAAFEPSYVDWIARTIDRDADLLAAARVVRDDLVRRGVSLVRRDRLGPRGRAEAGGSSAGSA